MPRVAELLGQFAGEELGQALRLSIFQTHVELALEDVPDPVAIRVDVEELGRIEVEKVLGVPMLVIEDTAGILVAGVRMDPADAARASDLLIDLRDGR